MKKALKILITGGGTGGHVFPAIAIADALKKIDPATEILFVGAKGKMEMERVPKAGYPIEGLWISGFQRKLTVQNLLFPIKLLKSLFDARRILKKFGPDVVVGVGGYASGPVMRQAQSLGIPTLIQEQNGFAGATNRILGSKAASICVAYDGMEKFFPAEKIKISGNPVRTDIVEISGKRPEAMAFYSLDPSKKTILILGGSLGARTLNNAMVANFDLLKTREDLQILWQCGRIYEAEMQKTPTAALPNVFLKTFIERMDLAYAAASVVVSRSGALSVSELCLAGKPTVFVPSPNVAEDHQTQNALALVEKGAARLVRDSEAAEKMLPEAIMILENDAVRHALGESIRQLGKPDAARDIAMEVRRLADLLKP